MNYSSRFWLYAPTGLFLMLALAAMIHWWISADAFEKKLAALKDRPAIPGVVLDWDKVAVGGFPFRLDADFVNFRITGEAAHGPFAWRSERFALHALSYGRSQAVYEAAGRQQLSWSDASGARHAADFLAASMRASSICDALGLRRFDLDVLDIGAKSFTIARLQFHMRRDPDGKDLDLMLRAQAAGTHPKVQVYATLGQAAALRALLRGDAFWPQAAADWRAHGGMAKLSQVVAPSLAADTLLSPLY
jgi:hypothetical protein